MILTLKSFSQDVDLTDPSKVQYYLVFDGEGKSLRLPVLKETTEALAQFLYSQPSSEEVKEEETVYETKVAVKSAHYLEESDDVSDADEFGGDVEEDEDEDEEEGYSNGLPSSEEEVPSL